VYQQTYEVGGTLLSNSPMHTATAGLVRRWGPWGTTAFDGLFVGPRRTLQGTTLPPAATFNLNLSVTPWRDSLRLYFGIFNLFDTRYSISGSTEHVQDAIPQNGRHFNGGAEYRFR
jgi:outer membrane receptor protein involved in Fe transport